LLEAPGLGSYPVFTGWVKTSPGVYLESLVQPTGESDESDIYDYVYITHLVLSFLQLAGRNFIYRPVVYLVSKCLLNSQRLLSSPRTSFSGTPQTS
jgi:hypothetical protein